MSLATFDPTYCADSVEFSPSAPSVLLCATYQLDSLEDALGHKLRKGRVYLLEVSEDPDDSLSNCAVTELQRIDTPAILDSKWCGCGSLLDFLSLLLSLLDFPRPL